MLSYEQYLRESAVSKEIIDTFLDESKRPWMRFDPEMGYVLGESLVPDGANGIRTICNVQPNGARKASVHADKPCRIHAYGDSFTHCAQVNDGETWEEYLAGHLGEPVHNFGVGGYGLYQAYRRMLKIERAGNGVEYNILYVWGDDHLRSLMRCRHAEFYKWWDHRGGIFFHNNFWPCMEMNLQSGQFVERENPLATPESLYRMTDPNFMVEALRDDLILQLCAFPHVDPATVDLAAFNALAAILGVAGVDRSGDEAQKASVARIKLAYGFAASEYVIKKTMEFCREKGKKLLISLFDPTAYGQMLRGEPRYDQGFVEFLNRKGLQVFDMNCVFLADYQSKKFSIEDWFKHYFHGHANASANHLFAYAIKDMIVDLLDPKPIPYRDAPSR